MGDMCCAVYVYFIITHFQLQFVEFRTYKLCSYTPTLKDLLV